MHDVLFSENLFLIVICYLYISSLSDVLVESMSYVYIFIYKHCGK